MDRYQAYVRLGLLLLPFGSVLYVAVWLHRRWIARDAALVAALIKPVRQTFVGTDESLREKAKRRRALADQKVREARQIASGHEPERRIRIVGIER